jgi:outer membrane protein TolC
VKKLAGTLIVIAWMVPVAAAQDIPLALEEAVARALKESPRVAELRAREEGSRASVDARRAAVKPQVSLQAGYTRTNHVDVFGIPQPDGRLRVVYPDIPDNYRTRLDVVWPLYTGGRAGSLAHAARAEAAAAGRDLAAGEADLRFDTTRAYWSAVTAAESMRVLEQALERTDAHLQDLRARLDAGLIPPNEVLTAEAQRSRQEVQVIESRHASELALAELRRLSNLAPDARVRLETPLNAPAALAADLDAQIAAAKASRPERAALVDRLEAAAARIAAAGASARPSVAVAGGVDYGRPNARIFPRSDRWQDSWDVSVNASWSLWDGGRRGAETGEAVAAERALRARLDEFDSLVALEVRQRRLDLEAGIASAGAAAHGVRSAAEARRVVDERFAAGVATSTDMLDAQVALLQAELDRTRALAAARIAEARLARAVGAKQGP